MRRLALILAFCLLPMGLFPLAAQAQTGSGSDPVEWHGSVALSWYRFDDATETEHSYNRPGARVNLRAEQLFGGNYELKVRFRTRYDDRAAAVGGRPDTEWRHRIYEANLTYDNPDSPFGFQVGRLISRDMGGMGYTDGLLLQHRIGGSFRWGVLAGTRPDWETSEFQTDVTKYGVFVAFERGDRAYSRFELKVAGIGEYNDSLVSREFVYVRTSYHHERRLDVCGTAELDVNRAWREDKAGESVTLSALFLRGRYRATDRVTLGLGYDTRKNYYTYEVRSIPDSIFIDAARQGVRATINARLPADFRLNAALGIRGIEDSDDDPTAFYSGDISKRDLFDTRFRVSLRVAGFTAPKSAGQNPSVMLSRSFGRGHTANASYGLYSYDVSPGGSSQLNQWVRAGGQFQLPARLYMSVEYQYDWGDDSEGHRVVGEAGYRF